MMEITSMQSFNLQPVGGGTLAFGQIDPLLAT